jgi:hypothetical protein
LTDVEAPQEKDKENQKKLEVVNENESNTRAATSVITKRKEGIAYPVRDFTVS